MLEISHHAAHCGLFHIVLRVRVRVCWLVCVHFAKSLVAWTSLLVIPFS